MKVGELRMLFIRLIVNDRSVEISSFACKLNGVLRDMNQESEVTATEMEPVIEILKEFWHWVAAHLDYRKWQESDEVKAWLDFQNQLSKEYFHSPTEAGQQSIPTEEKYLEPQKKISLLDLDLHHPILFQALGEKYNQAGPTMLELDKMMGLIIRCSRMIGYADKHDNENYPLDELKQRMPQFRTRFEVDKFKSIYALLGTIFYLNYHHCTPEQIKLLPFLFHYRPLTTDEERRSESAIVRYLTTKPLESLDFLIEHKLFFDSKYFGDLPALIAVRDLVPQSRKQFAHAITGNRWLYGFIQYSRNKPVLENSTILNHSILLLDEEFRAKDDQSYNSALALADEARAQMSFISHSMTQREKIMACSLLQAFCLGQYSQERDRDARDKHSFLSFSKQTKCEAATKKRTAILSNCPAKLTLFEDWALHQGKLDKANSMYEKIESVDRSPTV